MRRLHDEHHGTTACNDADSCPALGTGVRGIYLTAPLDTQAGTEVQIGLLPRLQPHFAGALYGDAVEVLAHSKQEHSVILTAQRDSFYNRGKLNYHPIGKDSRWAVQRLSRYPRCVQAPSGRGCAMNSTLALTSGSIGWSSSCPIPKRA